MFLMEGRREGRDTPSFKEAIASIGKKPLENARGTSEERERNMEEETTKINNKEINATKNKEVEDKKQGTKDKKQKGPCKPKAEFTPRVILNDPSLQAHRDHMRTYAIIYKFMGLWPTKNALQTWIKYHWKPKGSIDLHLGSRGFFIVVFMNVEDKDRVFEGGPYFYAVAGLYMRPWMMNFFPKHGTSTSILIWVRLYYLPLDYQKNESLTATSNKLGRFFKASEATRRGKYTSLARICVEMDLSGALPDEVILEVFDEEWVKIVDYEHISFSCCRCHEHGHLFKDCPLCKLVSNNKANTTNEMDNYQKVVN